jgi:peptidyl-prolyl cis-trans isomerase SurA
MKKRSAILVFFFLIFFGTVFLFGQDVIEEIVAVVNDDIITFSQFKAEYEDFYRALSVQFKGEEFEKRYADMKKNLLEKMITDLLLLQEAEKMEGLNPDEQLRLWLENLKKENNMNSDAELIRALQDQGVDFEAWKKRMKENIMREAVIYSKVRSNIVVDDSEIVNYYKLHPEEFTEPAEYKLRAIYLSAEGKNDRELEAKKQEINEKISSGEDIGSLASKYSEGPEKENKGDLGSFKKGELEKGLEQAVEKLKVGEMTPWLKVRAGWFLLKLEEKKESRLRTFEEARKEIEDKFFNEKSQKKLEEFLKNLKETSYIKILVPNPFDYM